MKSVILGGKGALILAVVLGSLTSYLVWRYVSEAGQQTRPIETTPVVVAAVPIQARSVVQRDMVRIQQVPVETRLAGATSNVADVVGKVARTEVQTGEQVLSSKLFLQRQESGLAFMVPDGQRAVSVGFTEVIGSGGLIAPGDHVDVIGVFEVASAATPAPGKVIQSGRGLAALPGSTNTGNSYVATMVLQDVEVLAVAQKLQGEDSRDTSSRLADVANSGSASAANTASGARRAEPTPQPTAKTATLSVSPDEALSLVLAEEHGKIRLALRRAAETTPSDATPKLARVEVQ